MSIKKSWLILFALILVTGLGVPGCSYLSRATTTPAPVATRDPQSEQAFETQLEGMDPQAVPVYQAATIALDAGDNAKAKVLYQQVLDLAPKFATAYRRLGYIELDSNNLDGAIELFQKALALEPDGYNQSALAYALINRANPYDAQEAFDLASAAVKALPEEEQTVVVWLLTAHAVSDVETMRQADEQLLRIAPDNSLGHYEAGLLAAYDGQWEKAEHELVLARQLGFDEQAVQAMLDNGISRYALVIRVVRLVVIAMGVWFIGLLLLFLSGSILSKATLRALASTQTDHTAQVSPKEHRLRSIYRTVITILSLYFYISIPFVILLLLLVVAGAFYIFISLNTIPIYFALVLVVMLIGSLIAIGRSIFSRVKDILPRRELSRLDAPELWALVEQVARKLEVTPVETIQLVPDTMIGVTEKGSILKKVRGTGTRRLLLGMGGLAELTQGQLAGILAHEYGHFSNRDTAGGNLAHQVYASLNNMAVRLIKSGSARFYNPVWLFILSYQRIFLRVTLGASRLQEILADRYAAVAYGSDNFIQGLKNYIHQSIAFPLLADSELKIAFETKRSVINLYDLPMRTDLAEALDLKFEEALARKTSKYDSHPAPQERIRLVEALNIPNSPVYENSRPALDLFPNPEQLQREMTAEITRLIKNQGK